MKTLEITCTKEHPIIFSTPMIQAILEGRKSQTRRILKGAGLQWIDEGFTNEFIVHPENDLCPYGQIGDVLYIKENFSILDYGESDKTVQIMYEDATTSLKTLDDREWGKFMKWQDKTGKKSKLFMFRSLARYFLKIENIRVERVQEISSRDVLAEGVKGVLCIDCDALIDLHHAGKVHYEKEPIEVFYDLWDKINGKRAPWKDNPWLWVINFSRIENYQNK